MACFRGSFKSLILKIRMLECEIVAVPADSSTGTVTRESENICD